MDSSAIIRCIWDARKPSTIKNYCYALRKWFGYQSLSSRPLVLPIDAVSACNYFAYLIESGAAVGAVKVAYCAMKWAHNFVPGITAYNDPLDEKMVKRVYESGLRHIKPKRNQKAPLTKNIMDNMFKGLPASASLKELRDVLIISLSYTLLLRHDKVSHLSCAHLKQVGQNIKITIIGSKTDPLRNGKCAWLAKGRTSKLLDRYLASAGLKRGDNHFLFGPISQSADEIKIKNELLSYNSYRHILRSQLERQGVNADLFGFHSCRSGGATELASSSTPLELMSAGRWKDQRSLAHYVEIPLNRRLDLSRHLD